LDIGPGHIWQTLPSPSHPNFETDHDVLLTEAKQKREPQNSGRQSVSSEMVLQSKFQNTARTDHATNEGSSHQTLGTLFSATADGDPHNPDLNSLHQQNAEGNHVATYDRMRCGSENSITLITV